MNKKSLPRTLLLLGLLAFACGTAGAIQYPYAPYNDGKMDPQLTGWPLTPEEITYINKPFYNRRPGSESGKVQMEFLPCTPGADGQGGTNGALNWYASTHEKLLGALDKFKKDNGTDIDILLAGDSITWQWIDIRAPYTQYPQQFNAPWTNHFGKYKTFDIGLAGDKTQGLLWRLDHNGTVGTEGQSLKPKIVILAIGHNDMFFSRETGTKAAANGILWSAKNLRERFPDAHVIVCKIFPNHAPGTAFYDDTKKINAELDGLIAAEKDPKIHLLPDMWTEMTNPDGTVNDKYFRADEKPGGKIHVSLDGYELWASKLQPVVDEILKK